MFVIDDQTTYFKLLIALALVHFTSVGACHPFKSSYPNSILNTSWLNHGLHRWPKTKHYFSYPNFAIAWSQINLNVKYYFGQFVQKKFMTIHLLCRESWPMTASNSMSKLHMLDIRSIRSSPEPQPIRASYWPLYASTRVLFIFKWTNHIFGGVNFIYYKLLK